MFNISLNNYRGFKNQDFNFSRVNILIGENSSGKSSLLKLLLAMKQSFENPSEVNLKFSGDYTDLGNYKEVIYYKNIRNNLNFVFSFSNYQSFFIDTYIELMYGEEGEYDEDDNIGVKKLKEKLNSITSYLNDSVTRIHFTLSSKLNEHHTIKTLIENDKLGKLEIIQIKQTPSQRFRKCNLVFSIGHVTDIIPDVEISKDAFLSLVHWDLQENCNKKYGKYGEEIFIKLSYLLMSQNLIRSNINEIEYINPIQSNPSRFFLKEDKKEIFKVNDIHKFINIISGNRNKAIDPRLKRLIKILKNFGLVNAVRLVENENLPVVGLEVLINDLWSNITDVGYGVTLQLPILFQAILSEMYYDGQILLIEQPEVHLHPSLQAKFIESLLLLGNNNTYIIETHSEHIIRKLQVLIKNKLLKKEDVTIHYFKRGKKEFLVSRHKIDDRGNLSPSFPSGFFDVSYSLVKDLL